MKIKAYTFGILKSEGDIGLSSVPNQILKKTLQRGTDFNLLVCSEPGAGAKTLICSIFNLTKFPPLHDKISKDLCEYSVLLKTNEVCIRLKIYIYSGKNFQVVKELFSSKNIHYLQNNTGITRERVSDPRIHASLLLISPLSFKPEDASMFHTLSEYSPVFPVITKRDVFTNRELDTYKQKILQEIDISTCLPNTLSTDLPSLPLSTIASIVMMEIDGVMVRAREYKWGTINAEEAEVSDLCFLRQILFTHNLVELKISVDTYYQKWKETIKMKKEVIPICEKEKQLVESVKGVLIQKLSLKIQSLEEENTSLDGIILSLGHSSTAGIN
ncbi:septin 2 [Nematocida sp. LUAm3]|nr:septin 2 [Nematocida sp. LUAm3]KAI5175130.1 septin 2 [Nematocida sp. LUAm2]KAI5178198.1 septin 2 [Nematocida sp. LUAm1]